MTATATNFAEREITEILGMSSYHRVVLSPNKPNIRYSIIDMPVFNLYTAMKPIIDD
jgi:superfamily II DNA helicase RecQ